MGIYVFKPEDAERFAREIGAKVRRRGNELGFEKCPYCGSNTHDKDTFSIDLTTGQFNCKRASCDVHGNMITLAKDFDFSLGRDADEYYQPRRKHKSLRNYPVPTSKPEAVAYMESRGISQAVTERYNITVRKDNKDVLVFPFMDDTEKMMFIKYRNMHPGEGQSKEWCEANCKPILFGMNHCDPAVSDTLVMTEGQIDSLSCTEAGIPNAVSVPTGAKGFTWVPYCWDFMGRFNTLVVFGDHEHDTITLLDEMKVKFHGMVKYVHPDDYLDCKDANELLQTHGADAVRKAVRDAVMVENPHIKELADVERKNLKDMEHFGSGLRKLDILTGGFFMGNLAILTGERGKGKSTLASQFGAYAIKAGYRTFFYSGELPDFQFKDWFDRQVAGDKNISKTLSREYGTTYSVDDAVDLQRMTDWYGDKAFIYDNSILKDGEEEQSILDTMKDAIVKYQCKVLVVDNLMTAMSDDLQSDLYRQQSVFVKALVNMAQTYNVFIILVVHPRKRNGGAEFDNDDVSGSANITNLAHIVMQYTDPPVRKGQPEPDCDRILRVTKNRNTGRTDFNGIPLWYQESSKRISEHDDLFDWSFGWEGQKYAQASDDEPECDIPFD